MESSPPFWPAVRRVSACLVSALILVSLLVFVGALAMPVEANEWTIGCVDCPKFFTGTAARMLRLDAARHSHVACGGDHLYYAWHDGTAWHHEVVDGSPGVGADAAFDLAFYEPHTRDLKLAALLDVDHRAYLPLVLKQSTCP